jgi:hypothetical protein
LIRSAITIQEDFVERKGKGVSTEKSMHEDSEQRAVVGCVETKPMPGFEVVL